MRILRLYAPSLIGDHTLCYAHSNAAGESCINEVPIKIKFAFAGDSLSADAASKAMTIFLPAGTEINDGDFLAVGEGDSLLRWDARIQRFIVLKAGFLSVSAHAQIWHPIRTAVLTVSDKGSRGERIDTAGPELERLAASLGAVVEDKKIVPDDTGAISEAVKTWCDEGYNLILTTGGTGLSPRDVTPEALISVAEKIVPGFGEAMRMRTLVHTPRAFLTRSVAVIRNRTLIIAFPGSQRGARQCFEAVSQALRHGVETLAGWDGECGGHSGK
jgi:molybdenum cofactor synthesis domain-containing protein